MGLARAEVQGETSPNPALGGAACWGASGEPASPPGECGRLPVAIETVQRSSLCCFGNPPPSPHIPTAVGVFCCQDNGLCGGLNANGQRVPAAHPRRPPWCPVRRPGLPASRGQARRHALGAEGEEPRCLRGGPSSGRGRRGQHPFLEREGPRGRPRLGPQLGVGPEGSPSPLGGPSCMKPWLGNDCLLGPSEVPYAPPIPSVPEKKRGRDLFRVARIQNSDSDLHHRWSRRPLQAGEMGDAWSSALAPGELALRGKKAFNAEGEGGGPASQASQGVIKWKFRRLLPQRLRGHRSRERLPSGSEGGRGRCSRVRVSSASGKQPPPTHSSLAATQFRQTCHSSFPVSPGRRRSTDSFSLKYKKKN